MTRCVHQKDLSKARLAGRTDHIVGDSRSGGMTTNSARNPVYDYRLNRFSVF